MANNKDRFLGKSQPPTMRDVAECAGVSLKSVSRVINNEPHVTARLRAKVDSAIAQLGYAPDMAARSLAGAHNYVIGVIFDNPSPHYTMKIVSGAYAACVERHYHLRFDHVDSNGPSEALLERLDAIVSNGRSDGFILTPPLCDNARVLELMEARDIRYSRIAPLHDPLRSPSVHMDDLAAAKQVADLLYSLGHRHIGFVSGPDQLSAATLRRRGFIEHLKTMQPEVKVVEAKGDFSFGSGVAAARELLCVQPRPSAIFAANDDMAAGIIAACQQMRLVVPDDLSICGFDDSWIAKLVLPTLTTVHQPVEAMAHAAAMQLLNRGGSERPRQLVLDHHLIRRDSVGPAR
ncbi:LacI family DNA-binding transcriptional regulator [Novosphingobium humi]|uniref:LacI family DNA-binding transcriptional regulator n=1 Tax=Novosphingobium humi TaxID=2282397 RepID=A0ABY7U3E3_9SPHN|nr:LacI family DNA-binding transcriptional regulator [Novosphingobium humi]WCT79135.1 LacI family DNA-binding transcriptional regulator [Novosphingobium humi]